MNKQPIKQHDDIWYESPLTDGLREAERELQHIVDTHNRCLDPARRKHLQAKLAETANKLILPLCAQGLSDCNIIALNPLGVGNFDHNLKPFVDFKQKVANGVYDGFLGYIDKDTRDLVPVHLIKTNQKNLHDYFGLFYRGNADTLAHAPLGSLTILGDEKLRLSDADEKKIAEIYREEGDKQLKITSHQNDPNFGCKTVLRSIQNIWDRVMVNVDDEISASIDHRREYILDQIAAIKSTFRTDTFSLSTNLLIQFGEENRPLISIATPEQPIELHAQIEKIVTVSHVDIIRTDTDYGFNITNDTTDLALEVSYLDGENFSLGYIPFREVECDIIRPEFSGEINE